MQIKAYIEEILGVDMNLQPVPKGDMGSIPMFIGAAYRLHYGMVFHQNLVLVEPMHIEDFSIAQIEKHFDVLAEAFFHKKIVLVIQEVSSLNRKRLIEKRINFIIPGKQLFLPDMLMDLRETGITRKIKKESSKLLPSAQFILIHHILHKNLEIEQYSFKELGEKLGYTAMGITKAIDNLKQLEVVEVVGVKEKYIRFKLDRLELWRDLEHRESWVSPVLKKVYVDERPLNMVMLHSNTSALSEYTDMNPSRQQFYAVDKSIFYAFQKNNALVNANAYEGEYCLEVWKYNPVTLVGELPNDGSVVDPLSLYLSLKDTHDERIEMAMEQIIEKISW
ncbi:hypothetical protein [uncultured Cytophaga sp.]|uniref:hypothetical protein n=1 Tax=uncultured Cytophaga sp. TaxID=160238 RepID=UPI00262D0432|nr:hypothetical protein [uncultured Cytophaga sp.]